VTFPLPFWIIDDNAFSIDDINISVPSLIELTTVILSPTFIIIAKILQVLSLGLFPMIDLHQ